MACGLVSHASPSDFAGLVVSAERATERSEEAARLAVERPAHRRRRDRESMLGPSGVVLLGLAAIAGLAVIYRLARLALQLLQPLVA